MTDSYDDDFMTGMKKLLGLSKEKIESIIEKLDSKDLLALQDAISDHDKQRATDIVNNISVDEEKETDDGDETIEINPLFRSKDYEEEDNINKKHKKRRENVDFQVGDAVLVGDDEISGTVEIPKGPHDLVGIKIKGKTKMFDTKKTTVVLDEGILGMTPMFDLARMQELAGISQGGMAQTSPEQSQVEIEIEPEQQEEEGSCAEKAMCALEQLEHALPGVTVAELKGIRARFSEIFNMMNESSSAPRKLKV
jgi:hypothetical protein